VVIEIKSSHKVPAKLFLSGTGISILILISSPSRQLMIVKMPESIIFNGFGVIGSEFWIQFDIIYSLGMKLYHWKR